VLVILTVGAPTMRQWLTQAKGPTLSVILAAAVAFALIGAWTARRDS